MMPCEFGSVRGRLWRPWLAGLIGSALPLGALSQVMMEDDAPVADEVRRYAVELVVFEYAQAVTNDRELFLPDEFPADGHPARNAPRVYGDPGTTFTDGESDPGQLEDEEDDPLAFLNPEEPQLDENLEEIPNHIIQTQLDVLDPAENAMKDIYAKLVELDAYRPIMRAAWTQATFEEEQTIPIRLRRLGNAPLRLDGTVKLYLSRYLHFVVDLTLDDPAERQDSYGRRSSGRRSSYGDRRSSYNYGFGYDEPDLPVRYRINEDRIFRNGELRYYDHPKFGVLARVTRVEEAEAETDEMFLLPGN